MPTLSEDLSFRGVVHQVTDEAIFERLDDDMNTAGALGVLFDLAGDLLRYTDPHLRAEGLALVRELFELFGIEPALEREPSVAFDGTFVERLRERLGDVLHLNGASSPEAAIELLIEARNAARKSKAFALSDRLRDALDAEGVRLHDSKEGTTWTRAGG